MKYIKFLVVALLTYGLVFALKTQFKVGPKFLPAFGSFMNPFSGFWQNADAAVDAPNITPEMLPGLKSTVKVVMDDRAVPHIFAENNEDLVMVQGYLTAKNRLWQIDISTRAASGRLSEILGNGKDSSVINKDISTRRMGMVYGAENTLRGWQKDPAMMKILDAYTAGVNAYINQLQPKDYPLEFKLLGYAPEAWTAMKSVFFVKAMAQTLAMQDRDVASSQNLKKLGQSDFDFLFPEYYKEQDPIIPNGTKYNFTPIKTDANSTTPSWSVLDAIKTTQHSVDGVGSNNWVVDGSKTLSKKPILCGDPHLGLTLPSIWYEVQLNTPEMNVYGVSLPGLPFVIIGFNEDIAWTNTNVGHDVADYFAIKWLDQAHTKYELDGAPKAADIRVEEFAIKGSEMTRKDTVRYTIWGPVVTENKSSPKAGMAFRWIAHQEAEDNEIGIYYKLNKAKNYDDFKNAIRRFACPAQNFAFADKNNIAIHVQGKFPIKAKEDGRFVGDGSKSANAWKGYIPFNQLPSIKNPSRGFVSSANQKSTGTDYPYYYSSEGFENYRGRIVNRFLTKMDSITVDDMKKLQNNNFSLQGEELLPLLINALDTTQLTSAERGLLAELKSWDFYFDKDKKAPVYFSLWSRQFYEMTWADDFDLKANDVLSPTEMRTYLLFRDDKNNKFFDDTHTADIKENAGNIANAAFHKMSEMIATASTTNPNLNWANYKDSYIEHLGRIESFNRKHLNCGGQSRCINSIKEKNGPSWRMIVEMTDTRPRGYVVYPGGQSGNPGNKHFDDFLDKWTNGEYYEALFLKNKDDKPEGATLYAKDFNPSK